MRRNNDWLVAVVAIIAIVILAIVALWIMSGGLAEAFGGSGIGMAVVFILSNLSREKL